MISNTHELQAEVRGYELDSQGIVNNAYYFNYFDHARIKFLLAQEIDWDKWSQDGYNIVLLRSEIDFKSSLKAHDLFTIITSVEPQGKLRIVFKQQIINGQSGKLVASAINTAVCVNKSTEKPCMPSELQEKLFPSTIKQ